MRDQFDATSSGNVTFVSIMLKYFSVFPFGVRPTLFFFVGLATLLCVYLSNAFFFGCCCCRCSLLISLFKVCLPVANILPIFHSSYQPHPLSSSANIHLLGWIHCIVIQFLIMSAANRHVHKIDTRGTVTMYKSKHNHNDGVLV